MKKIEPYKGNEPYIFISYSHRDAELVYPILARMQENKYRIWFDKGIDPGTEWDEMIATRIYGCEYFIAFMSKNYLASENCKDELNYARDEEKKRLLVYLEDVILPKGMSMRLNRLQSIFKHKYENEDEFFDTLFSSDGISRFISGENKVENGFHSLFSDEQRAFLNDMSIGVKNSKENEERNVQKEDTFEEKFSGVREKREFSNGDVYEGELLNGVLQGKGVYKFSDGAVYEGEFRNNKRNGKGIYRYANGEVYEGEFENDKFCGKGIFRYLNGDVYEGEFVNGKRNGKGEYRFLNGQRYAGEFENDRFSGRGKYFYSEGGVYEGEFQKDKRHGKGVYRYSTGDVYEGEFVEDKFCGYGVFRFKSGIVYEGEFRNNKRNGKGVYKCVNGDVYEGEFVEDKFCGKGTYRFASGDVYEGEFENDKYHGQGEYRFANGNKKKGLWQNGKFVS